MLKIVIESGKYILIREIDKVIDEISIHDTMKEAQDAKNELEPDE